MDERLKWVLCDFPLMCFDALLSRRTVWFTSLAGLQLRRDGVGKRSPLLCPLPRVRGNCQQPAGHGYCAFATAACSGRRCEHRRAEKCGNRSREAVPLWAQVPRLPHSIDYIQRRQTIWNVTLMRCWLLLINSDAYDQYLCFLVLYCLYVTIFPRTRAHTILYFSSV